MIFFLKNLAPAEYNYEIYDKELLTIIWGFEAWEPKLIAYKKTIDIVTDYKALKYFISTKKLTRRQAR
jgi:hypothetical protein